jgi:ferrous iron transport protein B
MGAIRREMNSAKWTAFAIAYQCGFAYAISLMIYRFGLLFTERVTDFGGIFWTAVAVALAVGMLAQLFRPYTKK